MHELRGGHADTLRRVVDRGWDQLSTRFDFGLPRHVRREVEAFLGCGDPERGFAWLDCADCDVHRIVPFTCKGRGFCPTCCGRRMCERAARWCEELLPHVRIRQWVLTCPWRHRLRLARDPDLLRRVIDVVIAVIRQFYERRRGAVTGAIVVVQRFGSRLNLNPHLHILFLDGPYEPDKKGRPVFHPAPRLEDDDVGALVTTIAERLEALLGPGEDHDDDEALLLVQAESVRAAARRQVVGGYERPLPPLCATIDGYNLHAGVTVAAGDREGLERLCRYICRPPLALDRLEVLPGGRVAYKLRRAWSDGTTAVVLTEEELVRRLVALVPPPRANQVHYHGVLSGQHAWKPRIAPRGGRIAPRNKSRKLLRGTQRRTRHLAWAALLWRTFGEDGWKCPCCGGRMRLRGVVDGPSGPGQVLKWLRDRPPAPGQAVA